MEKVVAVINDHTGKFIYVVKGYGKHFPESLWVADEIGKSGPYSEDFFAIRGDFSHFLSGNHYSGVCKMVAE